MFVLDLVARSSMALAFVLLASRASPTALLIGSLVAMAAGGSVLGGAPFAMVGALSALALSRTSWPLVELVCAGALVMVALRLDTSASLGSAATAFVVLAPTVVSGLARLPATVRRRSVRAVTALVGLALVGAVPCVAALGLAQPSLQRGVRAATDGLGAARGGDNRRAANRFLEASRAFSDAEAKVGSWWARPALALPIVGPNARAVESMAAAGARVTAVASTVAADVDLSDIRLDRGVVPLDRLRALGPPLRRSVAVLGAAGGRLRGASSPWLLPPVGERLGRLSRQVELGRRDGTNALDLVRVAPTLLGGDGPRRYFLAMQTPSESRATGGLIGNFGEVVADEGRLELVRVGRSADLNAGAAGPRHLDGPADYLSRYSSFQPESEWRNVNLSPHFPTVARVIEDLYPQSGGQSIDGVISVDPVGLAALLRVVGPVSVAGLDQPLTSRNAADILLFEQYSSFQGDDADRIEFLGAAAEAVWSRLTSGTLPPPPTLSEALAPAFRAKHILFSSRHPEEQRLFEALDVDGGLPALRGDSLAVITQNASGNKIDWFLRRSIRYLVKVDPATGRVEGVLNVRLVNGAPSSGLPDIVLNSSRPGSRLGENRIYLSIFTPWALEAATLDNRPLLMESGRERERRVYSAFVAIPPGGEIEVSLVLSGRLASRRYTLDVFNQTTVNPDELHVGVTLPAGWKVDDLAGLERRGSRTATRRARLDRDVSMELSARRDRW